MSTLTNNWNRILGALLVLTMLLSLGFVFGLDDQVAQIYDNTLGQDGDSGPIIINLGDQVEVMSIYTHQSSQGINFSQAGLYKVSYACTWESISANGRHIMENWIRVNSSNEITPSRTSCYIRQTGSDGNRCSNSGSVLYNASAGDFLELMGDKLQGTTGVTQTTNDCHMYVQQVQTPIIQKYDSDGGNDLDGVIVTVDFDTQSGINTSTYQDLGNYINITQTGTYKINYNVCVESTGQNSRMPVRSYIVQNNNTNVSASFAYSYIRETGNGDRNCNTASVFSNFSAGDFVELKVDKEDNETAGATITMANQSWILIEQVDNFATMVFENVGGQTITDGSTANITFDTVYQNSTNLTADTGNTNITFNVPGRYEVSYNLGWDDQGSGGRHIVCSWLRLNDNNDVLPSEQCDYSRGDPQANFASTSNTFLMDVAQGDYIRMLANVEGGTMEIAPNATWISIVKMNQSSDLYWNVSSLQLPEALLTGSPTTGRALINSFGTNNNVNVTCILGDCNNITSNVSSLYNMGDLDTSEVEFTCSNSNLGSYSALYSVNSSQVLTQDFLNVSCVVDRLYGNISIEYITPSAGITRSVAQNKSIDVQVNVSCRGDTGAICGNITTAIRLNETSSFGDGSDGTLTVTTANTIINNYTYITDASVLASTTTFNVNDTSEFTPGDEVLIIQMQNSSSGTAGTYEFATLTAASGGSMSVNTPLQNAYSSGTPNSTTATVTQVVRIPQFTFVTVNPGASLTTPGWNGFQGGILVFRATETVDTQGYINVSEKGFRGGGCDDCGDSDWGDQGEGYTGLGGDSQSPNTIGGGGGYGPSGLGGEPGAGGGHATLGGNGSGGFATDPQGGLTVGEANLSRIFFGGGAGGGGDNDNQIPFPEFSDGGGIAIIFAQQMSNARVYAKGELGFYPGGAGGTSGSGAGGSIWITSENVSITDINASGEDQVNGGDIGGAGGDGRVRIDHINVTGNTDPLTGFNGTIGIYESFKDINTTDSLPLWVTEANPQYCELDQGEYCILNWTINATGPINSSYVINLLSVSNESRVPSNATENFNINISEFVNPTIILYSPENASKVVSNGTISFIFFVDDDSSQVNCTLVINGVPNQSAICTTAVNTTINVTTAGGEYNWSVNVSDPDAITNVSDTFFFTNIIDRAVRVTKTVTNVNSNQYVVRLFAQNLLDNRTGLPTLFDFISRNFVAGSYNTLFDIRNETFGPTYVGNITGWDLTIPASSQEEINYSVIGIDDYNVSDLYIVGIE